MVRRMVSLGEALNNVDEAIVFDFDGEYLGKIKGAAAYDFKGSLAERLVCPVIDVRFSNGVTEFYILSTCVVKGV